MAANEGGFKWEESYLADADLNSYQFKCVKRTSTGMTYAGAGDDGLGILQDDPASGAHGRVRIMGLSKAYVNGNSVNISIDDPLTTAASGILVKATSGDRCIGRAEEAATADGVVITIRLTPEFYEP